MTKRLKNPHSLEDLVLNEPYNLTNKGEQFLYYDSGGGSNRF